MAFCTAINCMDGRVQLPVIEYLMKRLDVEYVDSITEPAPVKILSEQTDLVLLNSIFKRVSISIEKHGSRTIAIIAHVDCAGNPVDDDIHKKQLKDAAQTLQENFSGTEIVTLWIDANWDVHELGLAE